jgi:hypothetical protein
VLGVGNGAPKEETPKEVAAPAAAADSEGSGDQAGVGEDAASDGEAVPEEAS